MRTARSVAITGHRSRGVGRWVGLVISAVVLILILRQVPNLAAVRLALLAADVRWLLAGAALYLVTFIPRGARWGRLLAGVRPIPVLHLTEVEAIGFMANNVLPFRLGEVVRAYTLRRKEGVPVTTGLATIVTERVCDGLTLVLGQAALLTFQPYPIWVKRAGGITAALFLAAALMLVLLVYRRDTARRGVRWCTRPLPPRLAATVIRVVDQFDRGLHLLHSPIDGIAVAVLSALTWTLELGVYLFVMAAFSAPIAQTPGHLVTVPNALLLMILINFGSIVPSGPAYIGTFQAVAIAVLAGIDHLSAPVAFSIAWVLWATMVVPIVVVGFACLASEQLGRQTQRQAGALDPERNEL